MELSGIEWAKLLSIVNGLAGPLITAVAVVAAVLFFRADRRLHTFCLLIGCLLIFTQRVAFMMAWLPGLGYFERVEHYHASQVLAFNNITVMLNLVAWSLFTAGLLAMALVRFRESRPSAIETPA